MTKYGGYNATLGNVANTWGSNWQYFSVLAGLHSYLYLPVVFWPVMAYGYSGVTPKSLLSSQLVTNSSMGHSIGMHGGGISKVESTPASTGTNT